MNGYRELERQLRDSVKRRARRRLLPWGRPGRRLIVAVAPLALIGGVATAATQLKHASHSGGSAEKLAFRAVKDTRHVPACHLATGRRSPIVDEAPPPEVVAALPELATAPPNPVPTATLAYVRQRSGGAVLRRTLRLVAVGGGRRLLVFVAHGMGPFSLVDPAGCLRARQARLAVLAPDASDPARQAAERRLSRMPDTMPTLQSLNVSIVPPGQTRPSAGTGMPVRPGHAVRTGVVLSLGRIYVGLAKPAAASITIRAIRHGGLQRRVAVHHGLFAFSLPAHTGAVVYAQHAADGRVLSSARLRG
jgi:hypothetical protein